jgi:hypothetical protein
MGQKDLRNHEDRICQQDQKDQMGQKDLRNHEDRICQQDQKDQKLLKEHP